MNKGLLIFLVGIVVLFVIAAGMSIFFITTLGTFIYSEPSNTFKTMDFDGITANVPDNSNFLVETNLNNDNVHDNWSNGTSSSYSKLYSDDAHSIQVIVYSFKSNKKAVNETIGFFIRDGNLTEIHIDNVSSDIRTFISEDPNDSSISAIVVNDNQDKFIFIHTLDPKLAIKIAKTVKFK